MARWWGTIEKSISLRKNDLPALTALHAWERRPISEISSPFLQTFLPLQTDNSSLSCLSLSWGSRISIATESNSMPTKTMVVAGPSSFSC